jgi:hypothetical protein
MPPLPDFLLIRRRNFAAASHVVTRRGIGRGKRPAHLSTPAAYTTFNCKKVKLQLKNRRLELQTGATRSHTDPSGMEVCYGISMLQNWRIALLAFDVPEMPDHYRREKHCRRSPIFSELRYEFSSMITIRRIFMRNIRGFGRDF